MPRKADNALKTRVVHVRQKNGDIYVYERITKYNPEKRYNEVIRSKLIGKIPAGEDKMTSTRPRNVKGAGSHGKSMESKNPESFENQGGSGTSEDSENQGGSGTSENPGTVSSVEAKSKRVGATGILEWIGLDSGIDQDLLCSTDEATALKIISAARFLVANPGKTLPNFEEWQINHAIPYSESMSADTCYNLMRDIGTDASLSQNFFHARAARMPAKASIAFDSTTVSSYSENQIEARYGFNKDKDGLKTVKLLTQYCVETGQPVAYARQPGDIPDVTSVTNACEQLSVFGMEQPMLVMDAGFFSEQNIAVMIRKHIKFLMRGAIDIKWIRPELDKVSASIIRLSNNCPFEPDTYGITVPLKHVFTWQKQRPKGENVKKECRIYLHFFLNKSKGDAEAAHLAEAIRQTANHVEKGMELSKAEQKISDKYLILRKKRGGLAISYNDDAYQEAIRYAGWFVLLSNTPMETFNALKEFRQREKVEEYFRMDKQYADGRRTRVWYPNGLNGRFFIQFVVLCYHEHLHQAITRMKQTLAVPNGDPEHDKKLNLEAEKKLLDWLNHMSIERLFSWFDCIEETAVDSKLGRRRWMTETTERDRLFLRKLGIGS